MIQTNPYQSGHIESAAAITWAKQLRWYPERAIIMEARDALPMVKSSGGTRRSNSLKVNKLRTSKDHPSWSGEREKDENRECETDTDAGRFSRFPEDEYQRNTRKKPRPLRDFLKDSSSINTKGVHQSKSRKELSQLKRSSNIGHNICDWNEDSDDDVPITFVTYVSEKHRTGNAIPWHADPEEKERRKVACDNDDCSYTEDENGYLQSQVEIPDRYWKTCNKLVPLPTSSRL